MTDFSDLPYRPCVGAMVLNAQGDVWIGRRMKENNTEYADSPLLWQMPQGGIDPGEEPEPAALRELYEETGILSVSLLAKTDDWLTYDLPDHLLGIGLKGKYRGQKQKWFVYRFEGEDREVRINPPPDGHKAEFDAWRWSDINDLPGLIIPFKRPLYEELVRRFSPLTR